MLEKASVIVVMSALCVFIVLVCIRLNSDESQNVQKRCGRIVKLV